MFIYSSIPVVFALFFLLTVAAAKPVNVVGVGTPLSQSLYFFFFTWIVNIWRPTNNPTKVLL